MNFQQLRAVRETLRHNLNLTVAAEHLFTSQPGVSKQIRELEDELGVPIFVRKGKRFTGLTEAGERVVVVIDRLLAEADNLKRVASELTSGDSGELTIATTHTQARYALPEVVTEFKRAHPNVHLTLAQGNPSQVARMVLDGIADVGIATESVDGYPGLLALPGYIWTHMVVKPHDHPLTRDKTLTLEAIARFPIVTYELGFTGRAHLDAAFAARGLKPDIVIAAIDADVIKTYVELGMGVGIVASMAYDPARDRNLTAIDARHLFASNMTRVAIRRGAFLRGFTYDFIQRFAPPLTRKMIEQALAERGPASSSDYEL